MPYKDPEKEREYQKKYRSSHLEEKRVRERAYYAANPERERKRRESRREQKSEISRRYYLKNRERILARVTCYAKEHKEAIAAYKREWQQGNVKYQTYKTSYARARSRNDLSFRLMRNLRTRLYCALKGNFKSGSAVRDLGCPIGSLKAWLMYQFEEGMTWDNYGEWHIDHVKSLVSFDLTDRAQLLEACHWSNLQPLWAADNLKKGVTV